MLTMIDGVRLREMTESDWPQVAAIWAEGIATGNATFETEPPSWEVFDGTRRPEGRLVAEAGGAIVGWAALSPGLGPGLLRRRGGEQRLRRLHGSRPGRRRRLMRELVAAAGAAGIWTIQTSVFPENAASIALHERAGFRVVGRRERIAQLDGSGATRCSWSSASRDRAPRTRVSALVVPAAEHEARVVPAEAERVRDADLDLLARAPRSGCSRGRRSGSGVVWLIVGGRMPRSSARIVKIASTAPAAPRQWPVAPFVDEIGVR